MKENHVLFNKVSWIRRIGAGGYKRLVAVVGLVFLTGLYVAGMSIQLFSCQGSPGKTALSFSPVKAIFIAFQKPGVLGILLFLLIFTGVAMIFLSLSEWIDRQSDALERFEISKNGIWGTADFCRTPEKLPYIEKTLRHLAFGYILGEQDGQMVSFCPERKTDNRNMIVYGSAGSGKTRSFILPNILQVLKRNESAVILDTKGSLYRQTREMAEAMDYDVYLFDLKEPGKSHGWHCLKEIGHDIGEAHLFAHAVIENTMQAGEKNSAKFWVDGERNLLASLILYINEEAEIKRSALGRGSRKKIREDPQWNLRNGYGTMGRLYELLIDAGGFEALAERFRQLKETVGEESPAWKSWCVFSANLKEEVRGGIIGALASRLRLFQVPEVCEMFGKDELRFENLGRRRTIVYLNVDDSDRSRDFLSSVFITRAFSVLYREADRARDQCLKIPVNFICDEFANMGRIPDFDKKIATCRSRGIGILIVLQTLGALMDLYPGKAWEQIIGNCAVEVLMKAGDETTSSHFEWLCGQTTIVDRQTSVKRNAFGEYSGSGTDFRENCGDRSRPLMNSDEIRRLPGEFALAIVENSEAVLLKKTDYSEIADDFRMDLKNTGWENREAFECPLQQLDHLLKKRKVFESET